jgi:hypothetical protein
MFKKEHDDDQKKVLYYATKGRGYTTHTRASFGLCLGRQGYCVLIYYRVYIPSSLRGFWPLGNNNNRSIFLYEDFFI